MDDKTKWDYYYSKCEKTIDTMVLQGVLRETFEIATFIIWLGSLFFLRSKFSFPLSLLFSIIICVVSLIILFKLVDFIVNILEKVNDARKERNDQLYKEIFKKEG